MNLSEYLKTRGSQAKLARELGVSPVLIHQWATSRPVPIARVLAIVEATNGKVTKQDLRPDDWHLIWPEGIEEKRFSTDSERRRDPGRRANDAKIGRRTRKKTQ